MITKTTYMAVTMVQICCFFMCCTFLLLLFLSTTIVAAASATNDTESVVEYLPGFPGKLPFNLHTGYIGVGETEDVQLFYYFIESESNPEDDPLVLWLTGGPGCSALSGLIYEIGPFTIDYANSSGSIPALKLNEYSWTKLANIIFLDQPAGTGFSYANTEESYFSNNTLAATLTYDFLRKWLLNHPKYLKNPLYICGDSYSGIILPLVVDKIYEGVELGHEPQMKLKGYTLGNPVTDSHNDDNGKIPYAFRMGLLSDRLFRSANKACNGNYIDVDQENILCQNLVQSINKCIEKIRRNHILEPWCGDLWDTGRNDGSRNGLSRKNIPSSLLRSAVSSTDTWCRDDNYVFSATWANAESVQKALHIREGTKTEWARCNTSISSSDTLPDGRKPYVRDITNTTGYHMKFTHKSCRAFIYSGDHDLYLPHTSTERWIEAMELPIQSDWRPWFVEGQVGGYTMTYAFGAYELTYATVKGAGHTAPEYNPVECFAMISRWFAGTDL